MYAHWKTETEAGERVRPADLAEIAAVTYSAAWNALRRYQAGRTPKTSGDGLAPKPVRNVHIMLRRALSDAVAMQYISRSDANLYDMASGAANPLPCRSQVRTPLRDVGPVRNNWHAAL